MNPGGDVNQIENQTLLVIREYSLSLVNLRGGCFKTIEKLPLRGFSFLFLAIHPSKLGSVLK
jgi:hypothetical protein